MSIRPEDLLERIDAGHSPIILDVRSREEFAGGHVPCALHFPFRQTGDRTVEVPAAPDDEIVIYCGHGPRAWIAAAALRRRGFSRITYLTGHMRRWKRRGLREER